MLQSTGSQRVRHHLALEQQRQVLEVRRRTCPWGGVAGSRCGSRSGPGHFLPGAPGASCSVASVQPALLVCWPLHPSSKWGPVSSLL